MLPTSGDNSSSYPGTALAFLIVGAPCSSSVATFVNGTNALCSCDLVGPAYLPVVGTDYMGRNSRVRMTWNRGRPGITVGVARHSQVRLSERGDASLLNFSALVCGR